MEVIKDDIDNLLNKIKNEDIKALDDLYDLTAKILYRCAYSYLKNKEDSEDALSDTYYLVVKNIHSFKGKNGFNWLYTIIKNVSLNMIKKRNTIEYMDPTDESDVNKYDLSTKNVDNSAKVSEIIAIAKTILKPVDLNIILLHTMDEMIFKDIGRLLGILEATVRWKYNYAMNKLRIELERRKIGNE